MNLYIQLHEVLPPVFGSPKCRLYNLVLAGSRVNTGVYIYIDKRNKKNPHT